jgi:hypothetical protein
MPPLPVVPLEVDVPVVPLEVEVPVAPLEVDVPVAPPVLDPIDPPVELVVTWEAPPPTT